MINVERYTVKLILKNEYYSSLFKDNKNVNGLEQVGLIQFYLLIFKINLLKWFKIINYALIDIIFIFYQDICQIFIKILKYFFVHIILFYFKNLIKYYFITISILFVKF